LFYLFRRGADTITLTYDHKVTDPSERQRIISEGVELTPSATRIGGMSIFISIYFLKRLPNDHANLGFFAGLAVSRALGDHFVKETGQGMSGVPFISAPIKLNADDSIMVVASDGVRIF
jgi:serine/threonine protein phosphatase PrpC